LGGDVCLATSLDKESAEHFVATLKKLGGFEKETAAGVIVVHGRSSGSKVTFRSVAQLKLQLRWKDAQLQTRTKTAKSLGKQGFNGKRSAAVEKRRGGFQDGWTKKSPLLSRTKRRLFARETAGDITSRQGDLGSAEIGV
jgi:hypothetical protein